MSNDLLVIENEIIKPEKPTFMIAGFNQWANAGNVSSGIPEYLIEKLPARRIGHIRKDDFYIFQLPESHYMFRPPVKYVEGYEEDYQKEPIHGISRRLPIGFHTGSDQSNIEFTEGAA